MVSPSGALQWREGAMRGSLKVDLGREGISVPRGVLRRKFDCPVPPAGYELTGRLRRALVLAGEWRVCLVDAASGYGKTAFLSKIDARTDWAGGRLRVPVDDP